MEKDCAHPLSHHSLLHVPGVTPREVKETERDVDQSIPARTDLTVNNATMENSKRSFVLLKVVPLSVIADNGVIVTTYGLLDTAALSSMITSHLAERLKLHGTPEKVSIDSTVTQKNHDCELAKVSFMVRPADQEGPCFPVRHALTVESLNVSDRYCPDKLDLSEWPHLKDLEFPNVPVELNEVSVLIGQDVPQAHIVLHYCFGDNPQSQPHASKTPFGHRRPKLSL